MTNIFLGDYFSLDDSGYLGRSIANRTLLKAIFACRSFDKVFAVGNPAVFERLNMPEVVRRKLATVGSVTELTATFQQKEIAAIFCSNFGKKYAQLVHFRNSLGLTCPVFGMTHTLSYQDEVGALFRLFCAGPTHQDAILCTSRAALDVMGRHIERVRKVLAFSPEGPRLLRFPLGLDTAALSEPPRKSTKHFQVTFVGRLDWLNKADLLVIPRIVDNLPAGHRLRFTIAGGSDNPGYIRLLKQACANRPVQILQDIPDPVRNQLYCDSHVLFSPVDNYQETFGLTVIEAKQQGCVPVVSDFDGYRDLVEDGVDGILLKTYAARIPEVLLKAQILMPDPVYHGWWAAGVTIDPREAASALYRLSQEPDRWLAMSIKSTESASRYDIAATADRFAELLASVPAGTTSSEAPQNPFHIDYSDVFRNHPVTFWKNEKLELTKSGTHCLATRDVQMIPQLSILSGAVSAADVFGFLDAVKENGNVSQLLASGTEPIIISLALKDGLINIVDDSRSVAPETAR